MALSVFVFRTPLLQTDPRYFELSHDLEVPLYLDNIFVRYERLWNPLQSIGNFVEAYQVELVLPFLAYAWALRPPPMTLVELILIGAQVASGFAAYYTSYTLLVRRFPEKRILCFLASLLSGVFYMFSPVWASDPRHVNARLTFAFIPLLVLTLIIGFSEKKYRYILAAAFFWTLISGAVRIIVLGALLLGWSFVFYSIADIVQRKRFLRSIVLNLKLAVVAIASYVLFTAFRILPTILLARRITSEGLPPELPVVEAAVLGSLRSTIGNMVRFDISLTPLPFEPVPGILSNPLTQYAIYLLSFVVFSTCILGFFLWRKDREVVFLAASFIVSLILSTGVNPQGFPGVKELYLFLMFGTSLGRRLFFLLRDPDMIRILPTVFASITLGFAGYRLVDRVSRIRIRNWRAKASAMLSIALIGLIVVSIFATSWPMLTGNYNGDVQPVRVPDAYFRVNEWLKGNDGDSKVLWMPKFGGTPFWNDNKIRRWEDMSSSMPTYVVFRGPFSTRPIESYLDYIMSYNLNYRYDVAQGNRTAYLGKFLAALNVKYLVYDSRAPVVGNSTAVLMMLQSQRDLRLVKRDEFIYIFENSVYSPHVYGSTRLILADGGRQTLVALSQIDAFDPTNSSLYFLQELPAAQIGAIFDAADTIILEDPANLLPLFLPEKSIVAPFHFSTHNDPTKYWAVASTLDPRFGGWTPVLQQERLASWEFDYGRGLVYTFTSATMEIPFNVGKDGEYEVYVRSLKRTGPGEFTIQLDNQAPWTRKTQSTVTRFSMDKMGDYWLSSGDHNFNLTNLSGFNAVNVIVVAAKTDLDAARSRVDAELNSKFLAYISLPGSDLEYSNATIVRTFGNMEMNGMALSLKSGGTVSRAFYIPSDGNYTLSIRMLPTEAYQMKVELGPQQYVFSANATSSIQYVTIPFTLGKGFVPFRILQSHGRPVLDMVALVRSNGQVSSLDQILRNTVGIPDVKFQQLDATRFLVEVSSTRPFILSLAESFDPFWNAHLQEGGVITSFPLQASITGFVVSQSGSVRISIEYQPEQLFEVGGIISAASTLAFAFYWILTLNNRKIRLPDRIFKHRKADSASEG